MAREPGPALFLFGSKGWLKTCRAVARRPAMLEGEFFKGGPDSLSSLRPGRI